MNVSTLIKFLEDFSPEALVKIFDYDTQTLHDLLRTHERSWDENNVVVFTINED
jgi:hypothetical protein